MLGSAVAPFPCLEEEYFPCSPTHSVIAQLLTALSSPCLEPLGCHLLSACLSVFPQRPGAPEGFAGVQGSLESPRPAGRKDQSKGCHDVIPTVCSLVVQEWQVGGAYASPFKVTDNKKNGAY